MGMLQKLCDVLALFSHESPELSLHQIAGAFHWPRSTAYRTLRSIERTGFLERDETSGLYRLGIRLAMLGELAGQVPAVQRIATNALRRLSAETSETATLMILNGLDAVTIDVAESYQPIMVPGLLGTPQPLHATAGGKAMLAFAPPAVRHDLIRPPLTRYTPTTLVNVDRLMRDLETARRNGYTMTKGEYVEDVVALGAPVYNHRGQARAALTLSGTSARMLPKVRSMAPVLMTAAGSVSALLGYHGTTARSRRTNGASTRSVARSAARSAPRRRGR
jgi:IclR family transcriptional regulator, KDG regulon repressor